MPSKTLDMPAPKKPASETARVRSDIISKARIVAATKGMSMPDYLDSILRPVIDRDYAKLPGAIQKTIEAEKRADEDE